MGTRDADVGVQVAADAGHDRASRDREVRLDHDLHDGRRREVDREPLETFQRVGRLGVERVEPTDR